MKSFVAVLAVLVVVFAVANADIWSFCGMWSFE